MITRDKIIQIQDNIAALLARYRDIYSTAKDGPYNDAEEIWCKNWREPFEPDFADEIAMGNVNPVREVLRNKPRNKEYVSVHYFREGRPVRSFFIGKAGEIIADKLFIADGSSTVGIAFDKNWDVFQLTEEVRDERGRPSEYTIYHHDDGAYNRQDRSRRKFTIRYTSYAYDDNDRIVSAVYINGLTPDRADIERGWLLNGEEEMISDHYFVYTDDAVMYKRDDYSEQLEKHTYSNDEQLWKFPQWLIKRYQKLGIRYFG